MRMSAAHVAVLVAVALSPVALGQTPDWSGQWFTTEGVLELEASGAGVTGKYGEGKANALEGRAEGRKLEFAYRAGDVEGKGEFELDAAGHFFAGEWRSARGSGSWRGWRPDPTATKGKAASLAGLWRTTFGMLDLEQKGNKVKGVMGAPGWTKVEGEVAGRRLQLRYQAPNGAGAIWADVREDGKALFGGAEGDGGAWKWIARRLEGHARKLEPKAGEIVAGVGDNRLTYYARAPNGWRKGSKAAAIVFFHGSNMSARPYLDSLAASFGERYFVIGIDGEGWQDWSEPGDPRHNYTYVNWMGQSTYEGYPYTERESPALVAELIGALRKQLSLTKVFAGGHSQGAFLSYFLLMHFPELVDGVFPVSGGLVIQCEPDAFAAEKLQAAQRRVPLAVVHGENDEAVPFSQGQASFASFLEFGFPAVRLFHSPAGHAFSALPFAAAIEWLEHMSSDDPDPLLAFAAARLAEDAYREATAAALRLRGMKLSPAQAESVAKLMAKVDEYARDDAQRYAAAIEKGEPGWIDGFLALRAQFEFADAARPAMAAYAALRRRQEQPAQDLLGEARGLFNQGQRDAGWKKYEQIVSDYPASSLYARVVVWLAARK